MIYRPTRLLLISSALLLGGRLTYAQPVTRGTGTVVSTEDAYGVTYGYRATGLLSDAGERIPSERFDSVLAARAAQWISTRHTTRVSGFRHDAMGVLYIAAGDETRARAQFAARLQEPGLPLQDRAYTLALATQLFAKYPKDTARLSVALEYLAQLDALPAEVARVQYQTHTAVAGSLFYAGDGVNATRHYEHAFTLLSQMPFWDRAADIIFDRSHLENAAVYLAAQPQGRARIDSLARYLKAQLTPSPELVARNPDLATLGAISLRKLESAVTLTNYLGRSAVPVVAHYWWNRPVPTTPSPSDAGAMMQSMADGHIRLLEFGHRDCGWCLKALRVLDRLRPTMPSNVEFLYVTVNSGRWETKHVTAAEEAGYLKHFYLTQRRSTTPIALWTGPDQRDADGGWLVKPSPVWSAYVVSAFPFFMLVDGHGIVRYFSVGYSKDLDPPMRVLRYLIAEAERASSQRSSNKGAEQ